MLKELRKKILDRKKGKSLESFLGGKRSRKFYLESNFKKNKLFNYLLFLRLFGADLNEFFDEQIKQDNLKKSDYE